MKTKKRIFFTLFAALFGAMCFTACGGSHETFKGKLSDESFETENAALTAFLEDEIEGMSTQAELVEYKKDADLSPKEIAALPLGEIAAEEISHAERGTISYRATTLQSGAALTSDAENVKTHEIYLLELDGKFRYLVPPTQIGQPITKDYFEDVFSSEKYTNCTIEYLSTTQGTYNGIYNGSASSTYKFTANVLQYRLNDSSGNLAADSYIVERKGNFFFCAAAPDYNNGEWHIEKIDPKEAETLGMQIRTLGDFVRYLLVPSIDFSFFEKTKDGFGIMSAEKYLQIAQKMIGQSGYTEALKEGLKKFKYEFVVRDGRLEKSKRLRPLNSKIFQGQKACNQRKPCKSKVKKAIASIGSGRPKFPCPTIYSLNSKNFDPHQ